MAAEAPVDGVTDEALDDRGVERASAVAGIGFVKFCSTYFAVDSVFLLKKLNNVPCFRLFPLLDGVLLEGDLDDMVKFQTEIEWPRGIGQDNRLEA